MQENYDKTETVTDMRVIERNMNRKQKMQISVFDYVTFVVLFIVFFIIFLDVFFFALQGISYQLEGNDYGAAWCLVWVVIGSLGLLIFGIPTFIIFRSILKYKKFVKKRKEMFTKEHCVPATVTKIDFIDHTYSKDEYWLICDVIHEANHTIYRYASEKVKEDLFLKFKEGDRVAVCIHPEDPDDYYVDLDKTFAVSELDDSIINKVYKSGCNETECNEINGEPPNYNYHETDDVTGMRIIKCNNAFVQKSKFSIVMEWIVLVIFAGLFLSILGCMILGISAGISYHNAGLMDIGDLIGLFVVSFCIYGLLPILLTGLSVFFLSRNLIKYHKRMKAFPEWKCDENRIWATVKTVDFIDYKYAKDAFWVICDIIKEEEQAIYRYASYKVKEDLFDKITPGQEIAIYFNPEKPKQYYVNLDELK